MSNGTENNEEVVGQQGQAETQSSEQTQQQATQDSQEEKSSVDYKWAAVILVTFVIILILFKTMVLPALHGSSHAPSDLLDPKTYNEVQNEQSR